MEATYKIKSDLSNRMVKPIVDAAQNDDLRKVIIELTENGAAWTVPAGVSAALAYRKPDGTSGLYDKMPDGSTAITCSGNTATIRLAPQALSVPGKVEAMLVFQDTALRRVSTFPFVILVAANPAAGQGVSNDYYNCQTLGEINAAINSLNETANYYGEQLQDHWAMLDVINTELPKKGDNLYREPGTDMLYLRCGTEKLSGVGISNNDGIIIQDTGDGTEYLAKLRIVDGYPAMEITEL